MQRATLTTIVLLTLASAACADAPITAEDIESDGQLRQGTQNVHSADAAALTQTAAHLTVTGVLAAQAGGPVTDAARFPSDVEAIHLHLRVDDLEEPRPVTFVWTHGLIARETLGFLQPAETLSVAASLPVSLATNATAMEGTWTVQVFSSGPAPALLFQREFDILPPEQFVALAEPALAAAG